MAAEREREKQMHREQRRTAIRSRLRKLRLYGLPALVCILVIYFGCEYHWFPRGNVSEWVLIGLILVAVILLTLAFEND